MFNPYVQYIDLATRSEANDLSIYLPHTDGERAPL